MSTKKEMKNVGCASRTLFNLMMLYLIIPIGYPAVEPSEGVRRPLEEIVHHDHYEQEKFMSNERIIQFLYELRGKTLQTYRQSYVVKERGEEVRREG